MAMLKICGTPGCDIRTLGELCINHEELPARLDSRRAGRPRPEEWLAKELSTPVLASAGVSAR